MRIYKEKWRVGVSRASFYFEKVSFDRVRGKPVHQRSGLTKQSQKFSQIESMLKEMGNWKATPRDSVILKISNGAPIQDAWPTDPITSEIITSRCGLTMI